MTDLDALVAAVREAPTDATARLVLADALEECDRSVDAARQRVLACPEDDALRLAFAQACEDAGEVERGEFVRVQVEMAQFNDSPIDTTLPDWGGQRLMDMDRRERELTSKGDISAWFSLPGLRYTRLVVPTHEHGTPTFGRRNTFAWNAGDSRYIEGAPVRGFVSEVTCTAADWIAHADAIREMQPVRAVKLTTMPRCDARLIGDETMKYWLDGLDGEFDLFDLLAVLNIDGPPRALRLDEVARGIFAIRFPGIAFTLPTTVPVHESGQWYDEPVPPAAHRALLAAMRDEVAAALSIPPGIIAPPG